MLHSTQNIIFTLFTLVILLAYARVIFKYPGTIEYLGLFSTSKKKQKETRKGFYIMLSLFFVWLVGFVVWISLPIQNDCVTQYDKTGTTILWKDCK